MRREPDARILCRHVVLRVRPDRSRHQRAGNENQPIRTVGLQGKGPGITGLGLADAPIPVGLVAIRPWKRENPNGIQEATEIRDMETRR